MKTTHFVVRALAWVGLSLSSACAAAAQDRCADAKLQALTVGGKPYFVQAQTLAYDGRRALILGYPVLYWTSPTSDDGAMDTASVGVLWEPGHDAITVPRPPVKGALDGFRAASLGGGRWVVVFAALDSIPDRAMPRVAHLYRGETDGVKWWSVDTLPGLPDSIPYRLVSRFVRSGDELRVSVANEVYLNGRVAVYRRKGDGSWRTTVFSQPFASYTVPVPGDTVSAIVLRPVVEPGTTDGTSVLLVSPGGDSGVVRLLKRAGKHGNSDPEVARLTGHTLIGWSFDAFGSQQLQLATLSSGDSLRIEDLPPRDDEMILAGTDTGSAAILTYNYGNATPISLYRYGSGLRLWFERPQPFRGTIQMAAFGRMLILAGALQGSQSFYQTGALLIPTGCLP